MIDLKELAGDRYRITLDPSAEGEPRSERPWYYRIPAKYGFVSVHGTATLAAYARGRLIIGKVAAVPGVRVHQRGDDEIRVVFEPGRLEQVAEVLGARRRRRLSPEARARATARLLANPFSPLSDAAPDAPRDFRAPA